ncbi:MAG: APC family permease [Candidatus Dormibacteraceae bacterium]
MTAAISRRRRIKVRGGSLGPFLCWAVVFADIGTSVYYVPGILYGHFGGRSALFVMMTLVVFVLLSAKYAEVAWRYPGGGGVVTVASRALHPFAGLLGGILILVDYYLTAALSALSGMFYLAVVVPGLGAVVLPATLAALAGLGLLNAFGIRESARVSATFAILAAAGQLLVVLAVAGHLGPAGIVHSLGAVRRGPALTPVLLLTGYGAAFLAFSGLESVAQISPAMKEPRRPVARRTMVLVVLTIAVTSPLLTLWSTTILDGHADPNQFVSLLGAHVAGRQLAGFAAISGALLLVFASNTAIIGAYHVFIALARMGFLPRVMEHRNRWRGTPHVAILAAVALPLGVVAAANGDVNLLGDLYAFGLLGAFILTCAALDVVRWRERAHSDQGVSAAVFVLGIVTTGLVLIAWTVNLVAKPLATEFGGGLTVAGLAVGLATYRVTLRRRPAVFPLPYSPARAVASIRAEFRRRPAEVLIILPHDPEAAGAVLAEAARAAAGRSAVFLFRGKEPLAGAPALWEVADPYLKDYAAQDAFARAEMATRRAIPSRRHVYVPGSLHREVVGDVWKEVHPRETVLERADLDALPPIAVDRVRRHVEDGIPVLHLVTGRAVPPPPTTEGPVATASAKRP